MVIVEKAMGDAELHSVRTLYEAAFPKSEKKPFSLILETQDQGYADILAVTDREGRFCGLAIMILSGDLVLLDYLAVDPGCRGTGVGSAVLEKLQERYGEDKLVVEIERTTGSGAKAENIQDRIRRKAFYLRNGMVPAGFCVDLLGVEMEVLTFGRALDFSEYYEIYSRVFPGKIADKVRLV